MMRVVDIWFALVGLGTNKLRAALTTLGIIIGVGAVIMIVSVGAGLRRSTQQQMEAFSGGTIEVRSGGRFGGIPAAIRMENVPPEKMEAILKSTMSGRSSYLGPRDVEALQKLATTVVAVAPQIEVGASAVVRGNYLPAQIVGATPDFLTVYRREIKWGRFITDKDNEAAATVAVIDESLVDQFFGEGANPLGEVLHLIYNGKPQNYAIVGVLAKKEGVTGYGPRGIIVPLKAAQTRMNDGPRDNIGLIAARVDSRDQATRKLAVAQVNTILRRVHGLAPGTPEDFSARDTLEYSAEVANITTTMTIVLSLIAGISLVVGSIGLMNIMLVSVSERTWEVGLRRALGARQGDILTQFLAEAVFLSLAGGLIGLLLGMGGSYAVSLLVSSLKGMVWVTADVVLIAVGVSSVVGIVSGIYPAWRAALLQPTKALRQL